MVLCMTCTIMLESCPGRRRTPSAIHPRTLLSSEWMVSCSIWSLLSVASTATACRQTSSGVQSAGNAWSVKTRRKPGSANPFALSASGSSRRVCSCGAVAFDELLSAGERTVYRQGDRLTQRLTPATGRAMNPVWCF